MFIVKPTQIYSLIHTLTKGARHPDDQELAPGEGQAPPLGDSEIWNLFDGSQLNYAEKKILYRFRR